MPINSISVDMILIQLKACEVVFEFLDRILQSDVRDEDLHHRDVSHGISIVILEPLLDVLPLVRLSHSSVHGVAHNLHADRA